MEFKRFDYKMFEAAKHLAEKSDFPSFKIGCVLTYNGHIVGQGCNMNKSNPTQKKYNKYRNFRPGPVVRHTGHAEISAIRSVPYTVAQSIDWKKVKCYVYRISPGKRFKKGLARPCPACMAMLRDMGVRNLYFTTDDGYAYERLD